MAEGQISSGIRSGVDVKGDVKVFVHLSPAVTSTGDDGLHLPCRLSTVRPRSCVGLTQDATLTTARDEIATGAVADPELLRSC